jgi:hypothetical protein
LSGGKGEGRFFVRFKFWFVEEHLHKHGRPLYRREVAGVYADVGAGHRECLLRVDLYRGGAPPAPAWNGKRSSRSPNC